jgi:hypothetical protein
LELTGYFSNELMGRSCVGIIGMDHQKRRNNKGQCCVNQRQIATNVAPYRRVALYRSSEYRRWFGAF